MRPTSRHLFAVFFVLAVLLAGAGLRAGEAGGAVFLLEIDGAIGPATSDYLHRGMQQAADELATAVVIRMDTPGGLDTAMREIIKDILASSVPVVVYVAPGGSRAASAGTYILYASHVAAMSPATNLGAATPVSIGGIGDIGRSKPDSESGEEETGGEGEKGHGEAKSAMEHKVINDAVAYIRGLAKMRSRNADWAERAVREAASLSSEDALEQGVIDLIAPDLDELLARIDGRTVTAAGVERVLQTAGAQVVPVEPDWRSRLLAVITDPNVAYILLLIGMYGLFFEFANPGFVLPGVAGAICLMLALFAFQVLPVNYAGLGLILLGIAFMIAEVFMPSFGALGIGGVVAFIAGSVILMDTDSVGYKLSIPMIVSLAVASAAFFMVVLRMAVSIHRHAVVSGAEQMIGSRGEAMEDFTVEGRVRSHGEIWNARTSVPVRQGQPVRITALEGLTLKIKPEEGK